MANVKKDHKRNTENRSKDSLGKEKVGDKLGKNKPGRMERTATSAEGRPGYKGGMKGSMRKVKVNKKAY